MIQFHNITSLTTCKIVAADGINLDGGYKTVGN